MMPLPLGRPRHRGYFNRGNLVFRTIRGPVRILGGDDIRAGIGMVKRCVDHSRLNPFRNSGVEYDGACTTGYFDGRSILDSPLLGVMWMNLEHVFLMPDHILRASSLRPNVVLGQDTACRKNEWIPAAGALVRGDILGNHKPALASRESAYVHRGRALGSLVIAWPLNAPKAVDLLKTHSAERRRKPRNFIHDLGRMTVVHRVTHGVGDGHRNFPVRQSSDWGHH